MFSRIVLPLNWRILQTVPTSLQTNSLYRNLVLAKYKHDAIGVSTGTLQKDRNIIANSRVKKQRSNFSINKEQLHAAGDTERYGTFNRRIDDVVDAGDIADDEYHRNIPLRRDQLPQTRYENMIKKYILDKRLKEAIDVVEVRMKEDRVKPDYYVYELLIRECGRLGFTQKAFKLYYQMKKRGLRVTGPVYTGLFTACANTIHPFQALQLAKDLRKTLIQNGFETNEIIYNTMIKAFGRCGDMETAFQLVDEIKDKKLRMKIDTINHLLQVCCSDTEYGFRHALMVWHKIYRRKLVPDTDSFNLLIRCTRDCGMGDLNAMAKVIAFILNASQARHRIKSKTEETLLIEDKPYKPINETKFVEPVKVESSEKEIVAEEVCDQMPNLLSKLPHLGSIVHLSMVKTAEDRLLLLGGLSGIIAEMEEYKVRPNIKTFTQLLYTIPSTREAEHELIEKMRHMRVRADIDFFNMLIKKRILRKDLDGAKLVLGMIDKVKLRPDIATYGILAMGCATQQQAAEFIEQLEEKGIRLNIEILGALLKNATFAKDYDYTIEVLKYAINEDAKPSFRFYEILRAFKDSRFQSLQSKDDDNKRRDFNNFYHFYKKWQKRFEIEGLSVPEISKMLNIHPWKQIKEAEPDGIEPVKNTATRRTWKRQHTLEKLNPTRIERLQGGNTSHTDDTNNRPESNEVLEKIG